jgi:hypothetical protein
MAGLDAKVKSIIKDTVKSHSIKRDAIEFDQSLLDCELTGAASTRFLNLHLHLHRLLQFHLDPILKKLANQTTLT